MNNNELIDFIDNHPSLSSHLKKVFNREIVERQQNPHLNRNVPARFLQMAERTLNRLRGDFVYVQIRTDVDFADSAYLVRSCGYTLIVPV